MWDLRTKALKNRRLRRVGPVDRTQGGKRERSRRWADRCWRSIKQTAHSRAAAAYWRAWASGQREKRSCKRQIVYGADIFANAIDAIAATNHGLMFAADVIGKADARLGNSGVLIAQGGTVQRRGGADGGKTILLRTSRIHEWIAGRRIGVLQHCVAQMAEFIVGRAHPLRADAQVQGQTWRNPPVILNETAVGGNVVIVIGDAAARFAKERIAVQEVLEITDARGGSIPVREVEETIVQHRQVAANR